MVVVVPKVMDKIPSATVVVLVLSPTNSARSYSNKLPICTLPSSSAILLTGTSAREFSMGGMVVSRSPIFMLPIFAIILSELPLVRSPKVIPIKAANMPVGLP